MKNPQIIEQVYQLLIYMIQEIEKLPKKQKYLVGDRIELKILETQELLLKTYYGVLEVKSKIMTEVNINLAQLRLLVRILIDLKYIDYKKYEVISTKITDLGISAGSWKKSLDAKKI